jgi:hypothetical protein
MRPPERARRSYKRKPAYPKAGTGEDFPNKRPGTKVGESQSGAKIMQPTRGTQRRRMGEPEAREFYKAPLYRGQPLRGRAEPWRHGRPHGRPYPKSWPFSAGVRGKATRENPWPL